MNNMERFEQNVQTGETVKIRLTASEIAEAESNVAAQAQQRLPEERRRLVQERREAAIEVTLEKAAADPIVDEYLRLKQEGA